MSVIFLHFNLKSFDINLRLYNINLRLYNLNQQKIKLSPPIFLSLEENHNE